MLYVPRGLLEETRAHLLREAPKEGVGLWAGRREVERGIPLPNVHPSPRDIKEARWRVPYVIFGTDGVRAFLLPEGQEVALVVL